MNNNESPLSVAEQIEVLEAAKETLVFLSDSYTCAGLCQSLDCAIHKHHKSITCCSRSVFRVIPSFTFENAVLSGTVEADADPHWFWWPTEVEEGSITNRLNFLDYLIEKLKNEDHE